MDEQKRELIEEYAKYFETAYQFPPLISKIFVYLLLDVKPDGVTFEKLVDVFGASKSSVSNALHYLTQLKYIAYNTKIESRKRYYKLSPGSLILRLEQIHTMLDTEKRLNTKLKEYKLSQLKNKDDVSIQRTEIYIEHLEYTTKQLSKTISKLQSLQ